MNDLNSKNSARTFFNDQTEKEKFHQKMNLKKIIILGAVTTQLLVSGCSPKEEPIAIVELDSFIQYEQENLYVSGESYSLDELKEQYGDLYHFYIDYTEDQIENEYAAVMEHRINTMKKGIKNEEKLFNEMNKIYHWLGFVYDDTEENNQKFREVALLFVQNDTMTTETIRSINSPLEKFKPYYKYIAEHKFYLNLAREHHVKFLADGDLSDLDYSHDDILFKELVVKTFKFDLETRIRLFEEFGLEYEELSKMEGLSFKNHIYKINM